MNAKCTYVVAASCLALSFGALLGSPALGAPPDKTQADSGWSSFQNNDIASAKAEFRAEIAKDPADVSGRHGLATIDWLENDPATSGELMSVVKLAPNDPRAWSDWQTMLTNTSYFGIGTQLSASWKALSGDSAAPAALRASALEAVAESDRLHGDITSAKAIWSKLAYIHAWTTIGPFDNVSKSGFKKRFKPETDGIHLDAQMTGKNDVPLQWRSLPLHLDDGTCEIGAFLGDQGASVFYSATAVESQDERSVLMWFSPTGASKVWINGRLVLSDDIYRGHTWLLGDTFAVPVRLSAGENTILVKSADDDTTNSGFMMRFTNADGATPVLLSAEPSKATGMPDSSGGDLTDAQPVLVDMAKKAPANRQNLEALAILQQDYCDYEAARETIQQAIKLAPNDAWLEWESADILKAAGQQDDFRTAREAARAAEPDNVIAQESYFDDENTQTPADQRIATLRSLLKRHPHSPLLLTALSGVLSEQKLTQQSLTALVQAYTYAPGSNTAQAVDSAYSDAQRTLDQLTFDLAALAKTPGDTDLMADEAGVLDSLGKAAAANALYEKTLLYGDDEVRVLKEIAGVYTDAHQTKNAIAITEKAVALRPVDAQLRGQLADLCADSGNKSHAIALYQQAIALDPSQVALRDKIQILRGEKPILDLVPAINAAPLIAAAKTSKQAAAPSGVARNILDEGREVVYSDGATDTHLHLVVNIEDKAAINHYSSLQLDVESSTSKVANLRARLIKPTGKVIYPDTDDATTEVDFPALDVGDIIDVEYDVTDYQSGALAHNFWSRWNFDTRALDVDISQFSLITPKSMTLTITGHGNVPQPTQEASGDWMIRTWKSSGIVAKPAEMDSPGGADVNDRIDISTLGTLSEVVAWYTDLANSACTPDDTIRAKEAELTQGDTTDEQRVQHIVKFVRSLRYQSTPFRLSAYVPTDGKDVIRDLYGDCKDKAALLCSLLSSAGIQAQMILLSPRDIGLTPVLPSTRFDHAIARIKTATGWQWEDATADQMQYGYLPFLDQGVPALVIDPAPTDLCLSPVEDPEIETQKSAIDLSLSDDGSAKGTFDMDVAGNAAWLLRSIIQEVGSAHHDELMQGLASHVATGGSSDGGSVSGIDTPDSNVVIKLKLHADDFAATTGSMMLIKLPWADENADLLHALQGSTPRTTPLELTEDLGIQIDSFHITLPQGYVPDGLQQPVKFSSKWEECEFVFASDTSGITVTRTTRVNVMRVPLSDLSGYADFMKQIETEGNKQIVIKKSS